MDGEREAQDELTDDEVDLVCPLLLEPIERDVHQTERRVAVTERRRLVLVQPWTGGSKEWWGQNSRQASPPESSIARVVLVNPPGTDIGPMLVIMAA